MELEVATHQPGIVGDQNGPDLLGRHPQVAQEAFGALARPLDVRAAEGLHDV